MKKFFIRTFGCQMNVRDSEIISGLLQVNNYELTFRSEDADIIIFNTCSVRKHAEDKVWSELGKFKKLRNHLIIGIVGCMAQAYKEEIFNRFPQVDFVVGPNDIHKVPEIIKRLSLTLKPHYTSEILFEKKNYETDGDMRPDEIYHTGFYKDKEHAYVIISEGCSNYCSYCIVPYVRGELRNRNYKEIIREIKGVIEKGLTKITLLGQNVNAYQYGEVDFIGLLKLVDDIEGLKEISFITSHPKDTKIELFEVIAESPRIKKYLHLPVQSGSDRILKLMNRQYTRDYYLSLVEKYRKIVKNGALTTDIMVGFPTESERDFYDTYNLVKEIEFEAGYIFKYSPRPFTEAKKFPDDVTENEKEKRHRMVLELQKEISKKKKYG